MLEPHRGLPLERDWPREADERRDRIEQPPCRRGWKHTDAAAKHGRRLLVPRREAEGRAHQIERCAELVQKSRRGLNGMTRGRVAARELRLPEMRHAREALADAADEELAA